MKTCKEFQLLLDRKGRQEIPAEDEQALAEHLKTCPDCRAYRLAVERSTQILARQKPPPSWDMVLARVYSIERRYRRASIQVGLGCIAVAGLGLGLDSPRLLRFAAGMAILVLAYLVLGRLRAGKIARLGSIETDLLKQYRADLAGSIANLTLAAVVCGLSAAAWVAIGLYFRIEATVLGLCFLGLGVYCWTRTTRLKSELSLLR